MDWVQIGQDFLSAVVTGLATLLLPIAVTAGVTWIVKKVQEFKASRPDVAKALAMIMPVFVTAAEQANLAGLIEDKKEYAISLAQAWLESKGWKIDLALVAGIVEQAVYTAAFPHLDKQATA